MTTISDVQSQVNRVQNLLEAKIVEGLAEFAIIEGDINEIRDDITAIGAYIAALEARVTTAEAAIIVLDGRVTALDGHLSPGGARSDVLAASPTLS